MPPSVNLMVQSWEGGKQMAAGWPKGVKRGYSPNPGGRPKTKLFRLALIKLLEAAANEKFVIDENTNKLDCVAMRLIRNASDGDTKAIREIADRVDGKVAQEISGVDGGALVVNIKRG